MPGHNAYSERIRLAMKTGNNPSGEPISLKQLAEMTGWSFENCRKVYNGEHDGSRDFNEAVCAALGLPEEEMWLLAERSKMQRRMSLGLTMAMPKDKRLLDAWMRMTEADRDKVVRIAEGLALTRDAYATMSKLAHAPKQQGVQL
jgi:hypothetical protein